MFTYILRRKAMKMYESVLTRVRAVEEKNGIHYAKTDGKLYLALRIIYTVFFIYSVGINLMFIAGMFLVRYGTDNFAPIKNLLISVCVCTAVMIAGYILSFFKFKLTAGIISVIAEILLIPLFGTAMKDSLGFMGFKPSFYWRHLIPLAVLVVIMIVMSVIALRAKLKTEKQYKKVTENLYKLYNVTVGIESDGITDEQWEIFLQTYDPTDYKKLFKQNS